MKHGRPPEEVEQLAERLRDTRQRGQSVIAWVEQHAHGLQEMVRAGWTWAQLAGALNGAGITYRAGSRLPRGGISRGAWAGDQLRRATRHARLRAVAREAAVQALLKPAARPAPAQVEPAPEPEPADVARPKVRVFGAEPSRAEEEPDALERQQAEKAARARSLIADWKKGR